MLGGVLLLSPYSNRLWSAEDQAFLTNIAVSLVPIIQRGQKMSSLEVKSEQAKQALDVAQARVGDLERRNNELLKQMEAIRTDSAEGLAQAENIAALQAWALYSVANNSGLDGMGLEAARKLIQLAPDDWQSLDVAGQVTYALGNLRAVLRGELRRDVAAQLVAAVTLAFGEAWKELVDLVECPMDSCVRFPARWATCNGEVLVHRQ